MIRFAQNCAVVFCLATLAACGGGDGKEIIFDSVVGPETDAQLKQLPGDLRGDVENRRHTPNNPPRDMDPADGGTA